VIRLAQRTVCDRCGAVCKSEENVATFTFDLTRFDLVEALAETNNDPIINGEMEQSP
jgi:hypothetical protein